MKSNNYFNRLPLLHVHMYKIWQIIIINRIKLCYFFLAVNLFLCMEKSKYYAKEKTVNSLKIFSHQRLPFPLSNFPPPPHKQNTNVLSTVTSMPCKKASHHTVKSSFFCAGCWNNRCTASWKRSRKTFPEKSNWAVSLLCMNVMSV